SYFYGGDAPCGMNSSGDMIRRVDANGNTTCYQHDALHRVTQVSYPSGPNAAATPTKTFVYDAATVDGYAMADGVGKLVEAYTGPGAAKTTDLGLSYSPLGQVQTAFETTPSSGGWNAV